MKMALTGGISSQCILSIKVQLDSWIVRYIDRQKDRQIDRQIDR